MIDELRATPHPMWSELKEANGVEAFIDHWRATPGRTSSDEACFHILSIDRFFRAYFP